MKQLSCYNGEVLLEFNEGRHIYTVSDLAVGGLANQFTPGCTSIIGILASIGLQSGNWAAEAAILYAQNHLFEIMAYGEPVKSPIWKVAQTAHKIKKDKAADVGTRVHAFAQKVLTDDRAELPSDPQAQAGATAFLSWLHANKVEPAAVERMVYSRKYNYAGTTDFVGTINGERCVLDFKTSKPFKTPYDSMRLQLKAYAMAIEEEANCLPINIGWIVRLDKETGVPDPHRVELTDLHRDLFLLLRQAYPLAKKLSKEVYDELRSS